MFAKLRIVFTIIAAVCLIAVVPIGTFLGLGWAGWTILAAGVSFVFMLLCKQEQEISEKKKQNSASKKDFLSAPDTDGVDTNPTDHSENNE